MASASASHKLRLLAHKHLTESECNCLKASIKRFRDTHSVCELCMSLQTILDTPDKICLLPSVGQMMPPGMCQEFDTLCQIHFRNYRSFAKGERPSVSQHLRKETQIKDKTRRSTQRYSVVSHTNRNQNGVGVLQKVRLVQQDLKESKDDSKIIDGLRRSQRLEVKSPQQKLHKRSKTFHCTSSNVNDLPDSSMYYRYQTAAKKELLQKFLNSSSESAIESELLEREEKKGTQDVKIRKITLIHKSGNSLGFCIRGGKDLNAGIFVSEVDPGGQADRKGLKVGERILKVNDVMFKDVTHAQAVVTIKSTPRLVLYVAQMGQMPGGTPVQTPRIADVSMETTSSQGSNRSSSKIPANKGGRKVGQNRITITADEDGWLGFSVRGGTDYNMDVCVGNVDPLSPAERAGLKKGMMIEKVNEVLIREKEHMEIIELVTQSRVVILDIREGMTTPRRILPSVPSYSGVKSSTNERAVSPGPKIIEDEDLFNELKSTPPLKTSTPLPSEDHPAMVQNRKNLFKQLTKSVRPNRDATIVQIMKEVNKDMPQRSSKKKSKKKQEQLPDIVALPDNDLSPIPSNGDSKLDRGTIRMNLASRSSKEFSDVKMFNVEGMKEKEEHIHVKKVFMSPGEGSTGEQQCYNHLSTPSIPSKFTNNWTIGRNSLSPSSAELKDAKMSVMRQLDQDLTGKRRSLPFTPNVPPSPHMSGISKLVHRETDMCGDTDSIDDNNNGRISRQMVKAVSMRSSAYDMMSDSKLASENSRDRWTVI